MYTGKDFENMGKAAASQYIGGNKPLNDSITKIAEHYGLNTAQVARVVEQANVETYLKLNNISEDKYTEFDLADPKIIAANLNFSTEKTAALLDDYAQLTEIKDYNIISGMSDDELKRLEVADEKFIKQAQKSINKALERKLEELDENFSRESTNLYKLVKQASLETGNFGLVKKAMKAAVNAPLTDLIADAYKVRLQKEAATINFEDIDEAPGTLNENHPIVKSLTKMSVYKEEYSAIKETQKELIKSAGAGHLGAAVKNIFAAGGEIGAAVGKGIGMVGQKVVEHPAMALAAAGLPTAAAIGVAKGRSENSKANVKVNKQYVQRAKNLKPL